MIGSRSKRGGIGALFSSAPRQVQTRLHQDADMDQGDVTHWAHRLAEPCTPLLMAVQNYSKIQGVHNVPNTLYTWEYKILENLLYSRYNVFRKCFVPLL